MNRQQENQSRTQPKKNGIEVSSILQRRGAVRSTSEKGKQSKVTDRYASWYQV